MMHDEERRLARFLRQNEPPERDPLFRVKVLERRERQWFRRRVATMLAALLAAGAIWAALAVFGGVTHEAARIVSIGVVACLGGTLYVPALFNLFRHLRR
jgi:hypothetical protein